MKFVVERVGRTVIEADSLEEAVEIAGTLSGADAGFDWEENVFENK